MLSTEQSTVRRRLAALTAVPLLLLAAACGEEPRATGEAPEGQGISGVDVSGEIGEEPEVTIDGPLELEQTETEVVVEGGGNEVVAGEQALLHLYIANGSTGEKALATHDQGQPAAFSMSEDQIFKSVVDATVGETVGSRIVVAAVPADAFPQGAPQFDLAEDDNVVFVVDVMSVEPTEVLDGPEGETADAPANLPTVIEKDGEVTGIDFSAAPEQPGKELQVVTLVEGEGPPARDHSLVTFDYLGQVYGTKDVFDESYTSEPRTFPVGIGGLIQAWDEAIVGANQGSRLMIIAPPETAYGEQGSPPSIPGNATLAFVVDVLGVDPAP